MTLDDIPAVHAIDVVSFSLPWTERSYRFELTENPSSMVWVAELEQNDGSRKIVASVTVWLIIDEAHIGSISVHPDFRQQGIARQLLANTLIEAAEHGAIQSTLEVRRSNLAAQGLYRQFGFTTVAIRPHYYRDNNEDAMLMTLEGMDPHSIREKVARIGKIM
ncbi:MAG TPA: ribosomal protein S18-alanine N-acetyltransferase, partial [Anaerolineaceae bacterium]|nr:ribosomal protein S18-alanine N-acetyltransferase [Anaerolineaceae bacterium]